MKDSFYLLLHYSWFYGHYFSEARQIFVTGSCKFDIYDPGSCNRGSLIIPMVRTNGY